MIIIWKPVVGYEEYYQISNDGRVRSVGRTVHHKKYGWFHRSPKIMKLQVNIKGYRFIGLRPPNKIQKNYMIHRLVLEAFIGPCPEGMQCRHLDGNPANNHITNLTWGTKEENQADRNTHGTDARGEKCYLSKLTDTSIKEIRHRRKAGERPVDLGREFDVTPQNISIICRNKTWRHI